MIMIATAADDHLTVEPADRPIGPSRSRMIAGHRVAIIGIRQGLANVKAAAIGHNIYIRIMLQHSGTDRQQCSLLNRPINIEYTASMI